MQSAPMWLANEILKCQNTKGLIMTLDPMSSGWPPNPYPLVVTPKIPSPLFLIPDPLVPTPNLESYYGPIQYQDTPNCI